MNPFILAAAQLYGARWRSITLLLLVAVAVSISIGVACQERAIRAGSARAASAFDLVIGAHGSATQLILSVVYLQPAVLPLLPGETLTSIAARPGVAWAAPVAFGDNYAGHPVVGTSRDALNLTGRALTVGRAFQTVDEAVAGSASGLRMGDRFTPNHGVLVMPGADGPAATHTGTTIEVVGILPATGTPWDRALLVPIETVWLMHGLGDGHRAKQAAIGPPWDADVVPGVPAVVVKPNGVGDAYRLRAAYRTRDSQALFPAEVLIDLYRMLGNASSAVLVLAAATQFLVLIAILVAAMAIVATRERQTGALRAMGAPNAFILIAVWCEIAAILIAGFATGSALGYLSGSLLSAQLSSATGIALPVTLEVQDFGPSALTVLIGLLLAALPALVALRKPVGQTLRS